MFCNNVFNLFSKKVNLSILFYSILSILIESWKVGLYTQGVKLAIADLITYATNFELNHRAGLIWSQMCKRSS